MNIPNKLKVILNLKDGHERSIKTKKNIVALLFIKGVSVSINFVLIPIVMGYLNQERYGIWITISSIILWFSLFDIGLGNGLKNKFTEAVSKGDHLVAKGYVSSAYFFISVISVFIFLVFLVFNQFADWSHLIGIPINYKDESNSLIFWVFLSFCIRFPLQLINILLSCIQKTYIGNLMDLLANIIVFIIIILSTKVHNSLLLIGLIYSFIPVIFLLISNVIFLKKYFYLYKFDIKLINKKYLKPILSLGFGFFVIQISLIIIGQTDNIIILKLLGPKEVTSYSIVYKYFGFITIVFSLILFPFWTAFTEAFSNNDFEWVRKVLKKIYYLSFFFIIITLFLFIVNRYLISIWIGSYLQYSFLLPLLTMINTIFYISNNIFGTVLNGLGKIRLSSLLVVISALINIPLCIYFVKYCSMGNSGVMLGTLCSGLLIFLINPFQVYYFIYNKKKTVILDKLLS